MPWKSRTIKETLESLKMKQTFTDTKQKNFQKMPSSSYKAWKSFCRLFIFHGLDPQKTILLFLSKGLLHQQFH